MSCSLGNGRRTAKPSAVTNTQIAPVANVCRTFGSRPMELDIMTLPAADELSRDPAFQGLLSISLEILTAQSAVIRGMDAEQRRAYIAQARALRARLRDRSELSECELGELAELSGLSPVTIGELSQRAYSSGKELKETFPELQSAPNPVRQELAREAIRRDRVAMAAIRGAASGSDNEPGTDCETDCLLAWLAEILGCVALLSLGVAACMHSIVIPPLFVVCFASVITLFAILMAFAAETYGNCIGRCAEMGSSGS